MKLFFDIGNTRLKWAFEAAGQLQGHGSFVHRNCTPQEAVACIAELEGDAAEVAVINVAGPALEAALTAAIQSRYGLVPRFVRTVRKAGAVTNGYTAFEQLGVDRWAAVVGAWQQYKQAVCVADVGTALTIDMVRADGRHEGGIILPGMALMVAALRQDTSDIDALADSSCNDVPAGDWFGRDTLTAINRGAVFALQAAIMRAAATLPASDGSPLVVLTGGDAGLLGDIPHCTVRHDPHLVLRGLSWLVRD